MKKVISLFISLALIFSMTSCTYKVIKSESIKNLQIEESSTKTDAGITKTVEEIKYIEFGSYPQSQITDYAIISELNAINTTWIPYGYYSGNGSMFDGNIVSEDYMKYCDVTFDGNKYRGVSFSSYRPTELGITTSTSASTSQQDDNGYLVDNVYWFKYDPLIWRVLDYSSGFVLSENVIDSQAYNNYILSNGTSLDDDYYGDSSKKYYANNYYYSSIRKWLNEEFYNTAFDSSQKSNIKTTNLNNDCYSLSYSQFNAPSSNDKIFLLSYDEAKNPAYGFLSSDSEDEKRIAKSTDYAKCQGICVNKEITENGYSRWILRSAGEYSSYIMGACGYSDYQLPTYYTDVGIRPACKLSNLEINSVEN